MRNLTIGLLLLCGACTGHAVVTTASPATAHRPELVHSFKKVQLSDQYFAEAAAIGDLNRDGKPDIVSGPFWYEGPAFTTKHEIYPPTPFPPKRYADTFAEFVVDLNGDGWPDIVVVGFPGKDLFWFENPGRTDGRWERHVAFSKQGNEAATLADIDGDGQKDLLCTHDGFVGYATADRAHPMSPWTFHAISPKAADWNPFDHGMGYGDINGDGRIDILTAAGWWEHPPSLAGDPTWVLHPVSFASAEEGGAQMLVVDVDGDGDKDVITTSWAHGYGGLFWFEQVREAGAITFVSHRFVGDKPADSPHGVLLSQIHAMALADIDGDGIDDFVTGKREGTHDDPDPGKGRSVYWFKPTRTPAVDFVPFQVDDDSGIGTAIAVGDLDGDRLPEIVTANKLGLFLFRHEARPAQGPTKP